MSLCTRILLGSLPVWLFSSRVLSRTSFLCVLDPVLRVCQKEHHASARLTGHLMTRIMFRYLRLTCQVTQTITRSGGRMGWRGGGERTKNAIASLLSTGQSSVLRCTRYDRWRRNRGQGSHSDSHIAYFAQLGSRV